MWQPRHWALRVGRGWIRAEAVSRGRIVWAAEATYESCEELVDVIGRLVAEAQVPARFLRARVELERPLAQRRLLSDLPPVRPSALQALVTHQVSRFFRQNGHALLADAAWLPRKPGEARVALAVAVEEPVVDAVLSGIRAAGLILDDIRPAGVSGTRPLSLLPVAERAARRRAARLDLRRWCVAVVLLWLMAGGVVGVERWRERGRIDRELGALVPSLAALRTARQTMARAEAMVDSVDAGERGRGRLVSRFSAASRSLPDSAALTAIQLNADGSGRLSGIARRAVDVVAQLERTRAIAGPRLDGRAIPETVAGRPWERFTILFGPPTGRAP